MSGKDDKVDGKARAEWGDAAPDDYESPFGDEACAAITPEDLDPTSWAVWYYAARETLFDSDGLFGPWPQVAFLNSYARRLWMVAFLVGAIVGVIIGQG